MLKSITVCIAYFTIVIAISLNENVFFLQLYNEEVIDLLDPLQDSEDKVIYKFCITFLFYSFKYIFVHDIFFALRAKNPV